MHGKAFVVVLGQIIGFELSTFNTTNMFLIQRSEETEILNLSKIRMYHAIPIITLSSVFDYAIQSLLVKPFSNLFLT